MAAPLNPPKAPATYAEWSACLDVFESALDDSGAVAAMQSGVLGWTSGVAERFSERIAAVFNKRLTICSDRLTRELRTGSDEVTLVRALADTRRTLNLLHTVATLAVFPPLLREHLAASVKNYAQRSYDSLEASAKHDRSGRLASLLRHNSILRYETTELPGAPGPAPATAAAAAAPPSPSTASSGVRRRNILI